VSLFIAQAVSALSKVKNEEPLGESDIKVIDDALTRVIAEGRVPFQRFRDHFIIGTERFKPLSGFDFYRTILLHRKSKVWHPESFHSEVSVFQVYTAAQQEPPEKVNLKEGNPKDHVHDMLDRSHIGPCFSGTYQPELEPGAIEALQSYIDEISQLTSTESIERANELERFLREKTREAQFVQKGDLKGVLGAYLNKMYYYGKPRYIYHHKQKVADLVRHATSYARDALRRNKMTADVADHLEEHVSIGQICEYRGDWKWNFG